MIAITCVQVRGLISPASVSPARFAQPVGGRLVVEIQPQVMPWKHFRRNQKGAQPGTGHVFITETV